MDRERRIKIWTTRIGLLLGLIAIGAFVYYTARTPSPEILTERFEANRQVFAELREMTEQDGDAMLRISYDPNQPSHHELSDERLALYQTKLQSLQALSVENLGDCGLWVTAWIGGPLNRGERYAYYAGSCTEGLGPIVADLPAALEEAEEEAEAAGENYLFHVALKPLDNTWALVHEVEK